MTSTGSSAPTSSDGPLLNETATTGSSRSVQWVRYYVHLLGLRGKGGVLIAVLLLAAWCNSGIYMVQPDEQGVVLRFGKNELTTEPGLHYHLPYPFEMVLLPKVTQINQLQLGSGPASTGQDEPGDRQMLTGDENIVEAGCAVLWRIKDASQFLFNVQGAEAALKVTAESALREVIGRTPIQAC